MNSPLGIRVISGAKPLMERVSVDLSMVVSIETKFEQACESKRTISKNIFDNGGEGLVKLIMCMFINCGGRW